MASFLFNIGKKTGAGVETDTPVKGSPSQAVPEQPEETLPAADSTDDGFAPHDSPDIDTLGGEVEITYESMNGRQRHYTQIYIDPQHMPAITTHRKPGNTEYLSVKHELLTSAYYSLKPYMDFVLSLKGVYGRDDLKRALEIIIKRFLTRYWDMPASKDHHHAYPWGLVLHCLDVACAEAEKATAWMPMSEHGIDEINHARYLGMVVLLHFTKGLFHDAHKLYQYEMTGFVENINVKFDPLRNHGNVLDFKIVYSERTEAWGELIASPGKLNAIEFCALFPRELLKYAPSSQFIKVFTAVFDLEGSDSDRDSAKRDAANAGRATLEQMILGRVAAYFTTDSETTKPENNVFRVNDDWVAVISAQFLMKIRPQEGGVYTKDGVKKYLFQEEAMAGTASKYDVNLAYRMKRLNGKEETGKSKAKFAFIKASYLLQAFPDLFKVIGRIFFDETDRDAVRALCPSAENFIRDLSNTSEPPQAEKTAAQAPVSTVDSPAEASSADTEKNATEAVPPPGADARPWQNQDNAGSENEPPAAPETDEGVSAVTPDAVGLTSDADFEGLCAEVSADQAEHAVAPPAEASETEPTATAVDVLGQASARTKQTGRRMVKWSDQLMYLIDHYEAADSCPETGWLFIDIYGAFVRTPRFYEKMTNDQLMQQEDWGIVAAGMCRELGQEGLLVMKPRVGNFTFIPPGGGQAKVDGAFFDLKLGVKYDQLYNRIMATVPVKELDAI